MAVVLICQRVHLASGVEDQALQKIAVLHSLNLIWWSSESAYQVLQSGSKVAQSLIKLHQILVCWLQKFHLLIFLAHTKINWCLPVDHVCKYQLSVTHPCERCHIVHSNWLTGVYVCYCVIF